MGRAPSLCGVILAAGESTLTGTDKALLPWPPQGDPKNPSATTFLSASIRALDEVTDLVIVVAGSNEPVLAPYVYAAGEFLVRNPQPGQGQFSSLQTGLREVLNQGRDAAMVTLVDCPPANVSTLQKLRQSFEVAYESGKWAAVPEYGGEHGHPTVIGREMIEVFLRAPVTSNAREIEHENRKQIAYIRVDDPFVTMSVNTPEDYARLSAMPRAT
jgi:molybdenum cofactor cytidylyltransferase